VQGNTQLTGDHTGTKKVLVTRSCFVFLARQGREWYAPSQPLPVL